VTLSYMPPSPSPAARCTLTLQLDTATTWLTPMSPDPMGANGERGLAAVSCRGEKRRWSWDDGDMTQHPNQKGGHRGLEVGSERP
jgi:hypothetical protein